MPKVTVAIPTYNRAHYLKEAIESVLNQTYTDYELLVVDNASTDNTEEVVKSFNDKRIKYIKNETNIGMVNNWNKCIDLAQGEYLIIFHDDDIMKPELLEKEVEILERDNNTVLVAANIDLIDKVGKTLRKNNFNIYEDIIFNQYEFIKKKYTNNINLPCPTIMYRLLYIKKNKIRFNEEVGLACDTYMCFEINLLPNKLYLLREPLLKYRIHDNQESYKNFLDMHLTLYEKIAELLVDNNLIDILFSIKNAFIDIILNNLMYNLNKKLIDINIFQKYLYKMQKINLWDHNINILFKNIQSKQGSSWQNLLRKDMENINNVVKILSSDREDIIKINTLIYDANYAKAMKYINFLRKKINNYKYQNVFNYSLALINLKIENIDYALKFLKMTELLDNDKYRLLYGDILLLENNYLDAREQYEKLKDNKLRKIRLSLCNFVSQGYVKLRNHDELIKKCIEIFKENNYKLNITYLPIVNGVTGGMRIIYEHINRLIERGHNVDAISYYGNPDWFNLKVDIKKISLNDRIENYIKNRDAIIYTFWNQWYEINNLDNSLFLIQGDEFLFDDNKLDTLLREIVTNSHIYSESKFLAVSRFLNETIQKKYSRNCKVIKNAIDTEKFYCDKIDKENARPRIIIVGNAMLKFKGFDIILKALELVKNKGYDFDVLWITQSQPENCPDYIDVAINPPQDKIPELYRKSDIYICGSYYEACPLPPLEAMASGCAVITTKCGGIDEYAKEGYNCLMSDPGDYESIALNVVKLLENKELRLELVNNGLNTVKEFTWDKAIDILEGTLMANYLDVKPIKSLQIAQNSLSLCLITKDEEKNIARCINSVKDIVDEIVVVDTGSKDKTVEIAKSFGEKVKVINAKWEDDFSKARNIAIENASSDWILFLDADEEIKKEDVGKIRPLLSDDTVEAYILKFVNYAGTNSSNGLTEIHYNLRLFRNNGKLKYIYPVHENLRNIEENRVPVFKNADVTILHYGYLSETRIEKNKTERYIKLISKYLEEHPDDKFQHGNLAVEYFNAGNYNKALKHLLIATKGMDVNSYAATRLLRYLISTYSALKDYDTALRIINDAKAYYVDVPDFKFLEGMIYIDQKRYKKAIETFKECLSMGEYNGIFITMGGTGSYRAKYMIALCYEKLNKLNDAVKEYMEILKEHPKYQEVFIRVFDMFVRNEKPEDVYEFFNRHVDTKSPVNFAIMARLYINIGRFDIAKQYIDSIDIDLEGLNSLKGIIYIGLKDYENAIKHFEMEYGKAKEEANYREALCYIILRDLDKAKDLLWKITDSSDKKLYMTIVGEMKAKFDEVKDSFFNLLDLLIKLKEFDLYNEVLNLYVGLFTREEYERYGQMMINNGLDDLAVEAYIKAADLNSQNTEVYKYLAQKAYDQNMFNEALSIIGRAYNMDKTDVDIYRMIYKIYKALGQEESAYEANEEIKNLYPEIDLMKEVNHA